MRFLSKINTLLDEIDGAGKDSAQEPDPQASEAENDAAADAEASGDSPSQASAGALEDVRGLLPGLGLGPLQAAVEAMTSGSQPGDTARSVLSPSLGDWVMEEAATSGPSVTSLLEDPSTAGRRSPAPSLGTLSIATSGLEHGATSHLPEDGNMQASATSGHSSQWIHAEKESLETISSHSALGSLEEAHRTEDPHHRLQESSDRPQADTPSSDSPLDPLDAASASAAFPQVERLQSKLKSLEIESAEKQAKLKVMADSLGKSEQKVRDLETKLQQAQDGVAVAVKQSEQRAATVQALEAQLDEARRDASAAKRKAQADRQSEGDINAMKEEMEKELAAVLGKKDEQVKALRTEVSSHEKARREQAKELDSCKRQIQELTDEVHSLRESGEVFQHEHEKALETLLEEQKKKVAELEQQRELEQRQKHELAINVRSVEERSRAEIARLEAEHALLTQQLSSLQGQLEAEQQKCIDLSTALGEATQRLNPTETSTGISIAALEEARGVAEQEARELRERLTVAEEKVLDAQSMRDTFAKETDMYRSELKVARDERKQLEDDLLKSQEKVRELQAACGHGDSGVVQQSAMSSMQKEFEERVERYRDEVQYLRQKCEEKAQRCEQLLAEKSSLAVQLRNVGVNLDPSGDPQRDIESGVKAKAAVGGRGLVRALPVGTPAWLRSTDEAFRMVIRILAANPPARLTFFGYVILMHVWVLFVLQHAAVQ
eukprot:CAMPEP_0178386036 /NCGR_PEP_ID=MMETSP0689_2-20121128/8339_1 /TAXON_ID=160604 /ORGANISM="Amphidinium massartii, Strain CS-259" /LENGTH=721 /DNA_ID=CAMNT_0020006333 /DNA_START=27 /DNA_END=2192 /DNA_ORIENTATION=+